MKSSAPSSKHLLQFQKKENHEFKIITPGKKVSVNLTEFVRQSALIVR